MSFSCSVVIPTYNASSTVGEQLRALASQDSSALFEVLIADNGSTDDLVAAVAPWVDELNLRIVDASARRGPSAARNIGVRDSTAPNLLFCDADDVVSESWVASLLSALEDTPFAGGPCLPFADRSDIWLPGYVTDRLPSAWESWEYAFAGNLGITREAWDRVGGFDESLTGAEEIEFAWRAREAGIEPTFVAEAVIGYRVRSSIRGRLWHEYNSGRGTATLARRLRPELVQRRSWKTQARRLTMLASRFPRSFEGGRWTAWAATLAFEAGSRSGLRSEI